MNHSSIKLIDFQKNIDVYASRASTNVYDIERSKRILSLFAEIFSMPSKNSDENIFVSKYPVKKLCMRQNGEIFVTNVFVKSHMFPQFSKCKLGKHLSDEEFVYKVIRYIKCEICTLNRHKKQPVVFVLYMPPIYEKKNELWWMRYAVECIDM